MEKESDPKTACAKCLEEVALDPESYRIGHTKARREISRVHSCSHPVHETVIFNSLKWCQASEIISDTALLVYFNFNSNIILNYVLGTK
jgi:hypothetical protein